MLFTETMYVAEILTPGAAIEYRVIDGIASLTVRQPEGRLHAHDGVGWLDVPPSSAPLPLRALVADGRHRTCMFATYETRYSVTLERQGDGCVLVSLLRDDGKGRRMELGQFDSGEWDEFIEIVTSLEEEHGRPLDLGRGDDDADGDPDEDDEWNTTEEDQDEDGDPR